MELTELRPRAAREREAIARIEATGWGLFFLWVGFALVASVGWGIAIFGTGLISLSVQLARRLSELPTDRWSVGFGVCLSVGGLLQWLDVRLGHAPWPAWAAPAAFAMLGATILVTTWVRRR
jgi:hypothetical protein